MEKWNVSDVSNWLKTIGMGKYAEKFAKIATEGQTLLELTEDSLIHGCGIGIADDRKAILRGIEKLKQELWIYSLTEEQELYIWMRSKRSIKNFPCDVKQILPLSTSIRFKDDIYFVGGRDAIPSAAAVTLLGLPDWKEQRFTISVKNFLNTGRYLAGGCVTSEGTIMAAGGYIGVGDHFSCTKLVEMYDIKNDEWSAGPSLNEEKAKMCLMCASNDVIYCFGGENIHLASPLFSTIECLQPKYDKGAWETIKIANFNPSKKWNFCTPAAAFSSSSTEIIICGGVKKEGKDKRNYSFLFNIKSKTVKKQARLKFLEEIKNIGPFEDDNKIYIFESNKKVHAYDKDKGEWIQIDSDLEKSQAEEDKKVVVLSPVSKAPSTPEKKSEPDWVYSIGDLRWMMIYYLNPCVVRKFGFSQEIRIQYFSTARLHNDIFLLGGEATDQKKLLASTYVVTPDLETQVAKVSKKKDMPTPRSNAGSIAVAPYLFAMGGFSTTEKPYPSTGVCERYSMSSNAWVPLSPLNQKRSCFGSCSLGEVIYIFGGYDFYPTKSSFNSIERLNTASQDFKWEKVHLSIQWCSLEFVLPIPLGPTHILICGGNSPIGEVSLKVFLYILEDNSITPMDKDSPVRIYSQFAKPLDKGDRVYLADPGKGILCLNKAKPFWEQIPAIVTPES